MVDITASRSHDQPIGRGKPQTVIHAFAVPDGSGTAAIAQMQAHYAGCPAHAGGYLLVDEFMAGPVEAVDLYPMIPEQGIGNCVLSGFQRDGLMEGSVEDGYLQCPGKQGFRQEDALQVRRVVQRGQA